MFPLSLEQSLSDTLKQAIFNSEELGIPSKSLDAKKPRRAGEKRKSAGHGMPGIVSQQPLSLSKNILFCDAEDENNSEIWLNFGEAYERFTASEFLQNEMIVETADRLGDDAIPVDEFVLTRDVFHQDGHNDLPLASPRPMNWVQATELFNTETKLIPADFVWPSKSQSSAERSQFSRINTGMAAGESTEHAQLSGLYDVIEQDAFITHWLLQHTPGRVELEWATSQSKRIKDTVEGFSGDIQLYWLTSDLSIPCVMSVIRVPEKGILSVGISSDLDALSACEKAIFKAINIYNWMLAMKQSGVNAVDDNRIKNLWDHVRYYLDPANHHHLDFLSGGKAVSADVLNRYRYPALSYETQLKDARHRLSRQGYRIWSVAINKPDFLSVGISVNKIVVPGLQPMLTGASRKYTDTKRVSQMAGYLGIPMPRALNTAIHPFL